MQTLSEQEYKAPKATGQQKQYTLGERLVGLNFNPSKDPNVNEAKQLCARLADLLMEQKRESEFLTDALLQHTIGEILNAQMNVVKLLTLKY